MSEEREFISAKSIEKDDEAHSPTGYLSIKIDSANREKFEKWVDGHLTAIKSEMHPVFARFQQEDNQLEGNLPGADYPYPGCYSEDTEVLSDRGWINVRDVKVGSDLLSMDLSTRKSSYQKVTELTHVYAEKMLRIHNKSCDFLVTHDHRMLVRNLYGPEQSSLSNLKFISARELNSNHKIPLTSDWSGLEPEFLFGYTANDVAELFGWYISDGCLDRRYGVKSSIYLGVSQNPVKLNKVKKLLGRMGLSYSVNHYNVLVSWRQFPLEFMEHLVQMGLAPTKRIPRFLLNLGQGILKSLMKGLISGDGSQRMQKGCALETLTYWTSSPGLSDDVQELSQKIGMRARISVKQMTGVPVVIGGKIHGYAHHPSYKVSILHKPYLKVVRTEISEEDYRGTAYCFTVPPWHSVYVRRNGVASWCGQSFRVPYPLTKKKVREISNRLKQAYLDSDPIWAVTLSGEDQEEIDVSLAEKIERALDTAVDNHLECLDDLANAAFNSSHHGIGIIVPSWKYQEAVRKDMERWRGFDGTTEASLNEFYEFEKKYPNYKDDPELNRIHSQLEKGGVVEREFTYRIPVKNSPDLLSIEPQDARVYPSVDGYEGLRSTPVYGYVKKFRFYELQEMESSGVIEKDSLDRLIAKKQKDLSDEADVQNEEFELFIGTVNYALESDERTCYKVFYAVEENILLRVRAFPWWYGEPDFIPVYVREEERGFFKRGYAWDLKDDAIVLTVLLCMYLNGVDMANSLRLKVKQNSPAHRHLLSRQWSPHLGLPYKDSPSEIEPMVHQLTHLSSIVESIEIMRRTSDENTNTSSLQSGRESPTDPTAPASKVALLLKQVEPNMKESIRSMEPGFRQIGRYLLWLYYQGLKLDWIKEIPGATGVTADDVRRVVDRLNPRALLFETERADDVQRDQTALALIQKFLPSSPLTGRAIKMALSNLGSKWAKIVAAMPDDQFMPPPPVAVPGAVPGSGLPGASAPSKLVPALAASSNGSPIR